MPQRHIIKTCFFHQASVERNMFLIAAVRQQNLVPTPSRRPDPIIQGTAYLPFMIAQSVHCRLKFRKISALHLSSEQWIYIIAPRKRPVVGILPDIIVISGDKNYFRMRQFRKQIASLFQFPDKRLTVKQISRYQQQIRLLFLTHTEHLFK